MQAGTGARKGSRSDKSAEEANKHQECGHTGERRATPPAKWKHESGAGSGQKGDPKKGQRQPQREDRRPVKGNGKQQPTRNKREGNRQADTQRGRANTKAARVTRTKPGRDLQRENTTGQGALRPKQRETERPHERRSAEHAETVAQERPPNGDEEKRRAQERQSVKGLKEWSDSPKKRSTCKTRGGQTTPFEVSKAKDRTLKGGIQTPRSTAKKREGKGERKTRRRKGDNGRTEASDQANRRE